VLSGIKVGNCWGCVVGDVPVEHVDEHFLGNVVAEFFNLLLDVMQEGAAGTATNHHDEENWATPKEHCHGCSQMDGVDAYLVSHIVE
jgi:hypothetical protein